MALIAQITTNNCLKKPLERLEIANNAIIAKQIMSAIIPLLRSAEIKLSIKPPFCIEFLIKLDKLYQIIQHFAIEKE